MSVLAMSVSQLLVQKNHKESWIIRDRDIDASIGFATQKKTKKKLKNKKNYQNCNLEGQSFGHSTQTQNI